MRPDEIYRKAIVEVIDYLYEDVIITKGFIISKLAAALAEGDQARMTAADMRHAVLDNYQSPHVPPPRGRRKKKT